jgi:hypothetical protein
VNDKFLPIGGTDLWSHYPAPGSFLEEDSPWPEVPAPPTSGLIDLRGVASAAVPAEDRMVGSPRAAGEPDQADQNGEHSPAPPSEDLPLAAARARYEEAIAALDEHAYAATPFNDSTMAATH